MIDLSDRTKIRQKLSVCIDHTIALVTPEAQTNVYDCLQISNAQYADFEASLPQGYKDFMILFLRKLHWLVKRIKSADGKREAQDIGAIFNRLLLLVLFNQVSDVEIDMKPDDGSWI